MICEEEKNDIKNNLLVQLANLIKESFAPHEIQSYFDSHPRLGSAGHIMTEEEHAVWIEHGVEEHSVDTEVKDALILGGMREYFFLAV